LLSNGKGGEGGGGPIGRLPPVREGGKGLGFRGGTPFLFLIEETGVVGDLILGGRRKRKKKATVSVAREF